MKKIIELSQNNCQNCYKCIRNCPIKAIEFRDAKATVIEAECILCGTCVDVCPQNAKIVKNNIQNVKQLISESHKVCISIAPSYCAYFDVSFEKLSMALKKLGFWAVEETAIGAFETSREYTNLIESNQMGNIIVTACSSVVMLVERHYKDLIKYLAPVASPMMAHAKVMRETYDDIKVVFAGPCISKINEAQDSLAGGFVNHALTFADLEEWFELENIKFDEDDKEAVGLINPISRLYPKPFGILNTINDDSFEDTYTKISVDGMNQTIELFEDLKANPDKKGFFIEANICKGGCLGGPVMRRKNISPFLLQTHLKEICKPFDANPAPSTCKQFTHPRVFANRETNLPQPTEEEILNILAKIGKITKADELNCGGCGFTSCREKAIAVFQKRADIHMCLPYFRQRAENMSSTVIEHSPNGVLVFDNDQRLLDLNPTAQRLLGISKSEFLGEYPPQFYGETDFEDSKKDKCVKTKIVQINDKFAEQSILYVKKHMMYFVFVKDITSEEAKKNELIQLREETVLTAQKVIDKQMRVAQEIASLLGETTAQTKVALTKLKKSMEEHK